MSHTAEVCFYVACQHYHSIKETEIEPTDYKTTTKGNQIVPFPITCLQEQPCTVNISQMIFYLMLSHQGTFSAQASLKMTPL